MYKKHSKIIEVIALAIVIYILSTIFFYYNNDNTNYQNFIINKDTVFCFFLICSIVIVLVLSKVNKKFSQNAGFAFIIATFLKMAFSYFLLSPILNSGNTNMQIEKTHFFVIFFVFSAIETIVCVRILNKNE